jgi:hypothetical protein
VLCEGMGTDQSGLHYRMYEWVLRSLLDKDQPETPELEALRATILRDFRYHWLEDLSDEELGKLSDFRALNCNSMPDLE